MKPTTYPLLLLFLLFTGYPSAHGQTYVSGFISSNATWNIAGSPYIITGNAILSPGVTLTIDPGVEVKFELGVSLQVDGEVIAIGTPDDSIRITSAQSFPEAGDWGKFSFSDLSVDAVFDVNGNYLSGSTMQYCVFSYGGSGVGGIIQIESATPYFNKCIIRNSFSSGINCHGATLYLDSSTVKSNNYAGLVIYDMQFTSCGLRITNDSILNNLAGGIFMDGLIGCSTVIRNNYFSRNGSFLSFPVIDFGSITQENVLIQDNFFTNNFGHEDIRLYGNNVIIENNLFLNDTTYGLIYLIGSNDTIKCNKFILNSMENCAITFQCTNGNIEKNVFYGNVNNNNSEIILKLFGWPGYNSFSFVNNTIKNNSSTLSTSRICDFNLKLDDHPYYRIENNDFIDNVCHHTIEMVVDYTGPIYNFLSMKNNNLNNPASYFEFYNSTANGNPDIHIDSNYWGSTSLQYIDSAIYDYFNNSTKTVVYYQPILTSPAAIDSLCDSFTVGNYLLLPGELNCTVFPNPANDMITISFNMNLNSNASLTIYNLIGGKVKSMSLSKLNDKSVTLDISELSKGIYIVEVINEGSKSLKKLVVQ